MQREQLTCAAKRIPSKGSKRVAGGGGRRRRMDVASAGHGGESFSAIPVLRLVIKVGVGAEPTDAAHRATRSSLRGEHR